MVKDSWFETIHPNHNPAELLGVKIIKQGSEVIMNMAGIKENYWPLIHQYIAYIDNNRESPLSLECTNHVLSWIYKRYFSFYTVSDEWKELL